MELLGDADVSTVPDDDADDLDGQDDDNDGEVDEVPRSPEDAEDSFMSTSGSRGLEDALYAAVMVRRSRRMQAWLKDTRIPSILAAWPSWELLWCHMVHQCMYTGAWHEAWLLMSELQLPIAVTPIMVRSMAFAAVTRTKPIALLHVLQWADSRGCRLLPAESAATIAPPSDPKTARRMLTVEELGAVEGLLIPLADFALVTLATAGLATFAQRLLNANPHLVHTPPGLRIVHAGLRRHCGFLRKAHWTLFEWFRDRFPSMLHADGLVVGHPPIPAGVTGVAAAMTAAGFLALPDSVSVSMVDSVESATSAAESLEASPLVGFDCEWAAVPAGFSDAVLAIAQSYLERDPPVRIMVIPADGTRLPSKPSEATAATASSSSSATSSSSSSSGSGSSSISITAATPSTEGSLPPRTGPTPILASSLRRGPPRAPAQLVQLSTLDQVFLLDPVAMRACGPAGIEALQRISNALFNPGSSTSPVSTRRSPVARVGAAEDSAAAVGPSSQGAKASEAFPALSSLGDSGHHSAPATTTATATPHAVADSASAASAPAAGPGLPSSSDTESSATTAAVSLPGKGVVPIMPLLVGFDCRRDMSALRTACMTDPRSVPPTEPVGPEVVDAMHTSLPSSVRTSEGRKLLDLAAREWRVRLGQPATSHGASLSALVKGVLGRPLDKTECVSDWSRRPLTDAQLHYAALDAFLHVDAAMLFIIGLGMGDEDDVTVKGEAAIRSSDLVFLEMYTSILGIDNARLAANYGKEIIIADRDMVETGADAILEPARTRNVSFLVVGDALCATTHTDLALRALDMGIDVRVIHNASIMNAVASCGLQLYNFGQTITIPFWTESWQPDSFYDKILHNHTGGLHTLCLLDIKVKEPDFEAMARGKKTFLPPRYMTVAQAARILLAIESRRGNGICLPSARAVGVCRVGMVDQVIASGTLAEMARADFGPPLHSLVLVGATHEMEDALLARLAIRAGATSVPRPAPRHPTEALPERPLVTLLPDDEPTPPAVPGLSEASTSAASASAES